MLPWFAELAMPPALISSEHIGKGEPRQGDGTQRSETQKENREAETGASGGERKGNPKTPSVS